MCNNFITDINIKRQLVELYNRGILMCQLIKSDLFTKTIQQKDMRMECYLPECKSGCNRGTLRDPHTSINKTYHLSKFSLFCSDFKCGKFTSTLDAKVLL
jgi:hypothetical protein